MRQVRHLLLLFTLLTALPLAAQQSEYNLRVTVKSSDGAPIGGALIELVDPSGRVVMQGMSASTGYRQLRAPGGNYRIRIKRIGYEPSLTEAIQLSTDIERTVVVSDKRITLSRVLVTSKSQCKLGENEGVDIVWEEISKALVGASLNLADLKDAAGWRLFSRRYSQNGKLISADTTPVSASVTRPFGAIDPKVLRDRGYVLGNAQFGWTYYAPDETVLLSPEFIQTHCFKLVRSKDRPNHVGLAFEPNPSRRTSDISGTLWLDEATSELQDINFRYVRVEALPKLKAGGDVHFRRLASGAWIVDSWTLRFPRFKTSRGFADIQVSEDGYTEEGGFVTILH